MTDGLTIWTFRGKKNSQKEANKQKDLRSGCGKAKRVKEGKREIFVGHIRDEKDENDAAGWKDRLRTLGIGATWSHSISGPQGPNLP